MRFYWVSEDGTRTAIYDVPDDAFTEAAIKRLTGMDARTPSAADKARFEALPLTARTALASTVEAQPTKE